ncbi:DUF58 domain-containing protein [Agaribacter flavus]|uniref:DUF58 domain-containing protein n=1 Tax=Agaribacter flavus TaxID=1902781 RepID=A0ABV7FLD0_9ALTE
MSLSSVRPSPLFLKIAAIVLLSTVFLPWLDSLNNSQYWQFLPFAFGVLLVLVALSDWVMSRKAPQIALKRDLSEILSLYQNTAVKFAFANRSDAPLSFWWKEKTPDHWQLVTETAYVTLQANEECELSYFVTPQKRGAATIGGTYLRVGSFIGLWQLTWFKPYPSEHKVYPNFSAITDLSGLNGNLNLRQSGLKKYNMRGAGMDFLQLRDYREGEALRQVDWRASSRFNKLISKEFQEEKNQHILIMLDAGRRMRVQDDDLSYFEHALNALILLSFTALKNGDKLSIQSFGSQTRWLNQVKGVQNVSRMLHHFYDLYPDTISSDYIGASQELMLKHGKRSLVLLVSCLRDEDFDELLSAVKLLQDKHLVAVISIQEPIYQDIEKHAIDELDEALTYASSTILLRNIQHNIKKLQHQGVICIQTEASGLTSSLINTYLSIKKAGFL